VAKRSRAQVRPRLNTSSMKNPGGWISANLVIEAIGFCIAFPSPMATAVPK